MGSCNLGEQAGAAFEIIKNDPAELVAYFFDGNSMSSFVLNKENGLTAKAGEGIRMPLREARRLAIAISTVICVHVGCNSTTAPPPLPAGYAGEWRGTTLQGTDVHFRVSGDNVTSFNRIVLSPRTAMCAADDVVTALCRQRRSERRCFRRSPRAR